jgi:uncharacterized protein with PQ loop repeat
MGLFLKILQWFSYSLLVLILDESIYRLRDMNQLELGVFIVVPVGLFALLYCGVLSVAITRSNRMFMNHPDEVSKASVFTLAFLVILPVLLVSYLTFV